MAKADKKPAKEDKAEKETAPEFKYGVQDIADKLEIKPASVRVQLRNKGIEKAGKSYGWNSKADLQEVIDQLKGDDEDEKPAKSKKADKKAPAKEDKKAAKGKASKKSSKKDEDDDD